MKPTKRFDIKSFWPKAPADLRRALATNPKAKAAWEDITPIARRDWIVSIMTAKQKETRERRIKKACSMLSSGKRRLCCFPGVKWMMRDPKSREMLQTLTKKKS